MSKKQTDNRYTPAYYKQVKTDGNQKSAAVSVKTKKLWTILTIVIAAVIAVTASLCVALHKDTIPKNTSSESVKQGKSDKTIANSNFKYTYADGQNLQYPLVANDWKTSENNDISRIAMGVLDTSDWEKANADLMSKGIFSSALPNPHYPNYQTSTGFDKDKSRIYMMAKTSRASSDAANVTSASFSVASGSYTKITVWANIVDCNGTGLYFGIKDSASAASSSYLKVFNIPANAEGWKEYSIYVEGDKSSSKTLYLEFGMGRDAISGPKESAYGTVFFGGIDSTDISKGAYNGHIQTSVDETKNYVSYSFDDKTAAKTLAEWSKDSNKESATQVYQTITYAEYKAEASLQAGSDAIMPFKGEDSDTMYKLDAATATSLVFNTFTVNPPSVNKCYRLSLWLRTVENTRTSGAYVYLNAYDRNGNRSDDNAAYFSDIHTDIDLVNSTYNGWKEYSFYIQPSETDTFTMELQITIGLRGGQEDFKPAEGKIYLTEIYLYEIDRSDYNSASSGATVKTLALNSSASTDNVIKNGSFNSSKTSAPVNDAVEYPFPAANWKSLYAGQRSIVKDYDSTNVAPSRPVYSTDYSSKGGIIYKAQGNTVYGEFGVTEDDFYAGDDDAHSVLAIYNKQMTAHGYSSGEISLAANTFYRISVLAKGIGSATPSIYLTDGKYTVLASYEGLNNGDYVGKSYVNIDKNINGTGYNRYYFYVATGDNAKTVYLELWLGNRASNALNGYQQGTVLFDQAECLKLGDVKNNVSEEYASLFDGDAPKATVNADLKKLYTEQQNVVSNVANLKVLDYRYNDNKDTTDLQKVIDFAKEQTEITDELLDMINTFNKKYYGTEKSGKYYIDTKDNDSSVSALRIYLNKLLNPTEDKDNKPDETEKEPINWVVVSSLIVTVAMLVAIVAIVIRKMTKNHKNREEFTNNYAG